MVQPTDQISHAVVAPAMVMISGATAKTRDRFRQPYSSIIALREEAFALLQ
jgi:hypothetical protein